MPTSAAGNKAGSAIVRARRLRGFTLIELMVVVAIIAIATAGVSFALRDSGGRQLDREATRLAALFEAARAQSRSTGRPIVWHPVEGGFRFEGAQPGSLPEGWLAPGVQVAGAPRLVLGPEPVIGPQEVVLGSSAAPGRSVRVVTAGVGPFQVQEQSTP